jgi:lycopene cyclase domain-containing protein
MTYREFLGLVLAPGVVAMASVLAFRAARSRGVDYPLRAALTCLGVIVPVAVVFTTPWDSWLIANSVWWYPPGSVLGTVFRVPFEEYLFMIGLTALTGCWTISAALGAPRARPVPDQPRRRIVTSLAWLVAAAAGGIAMLYTQRAMYLGSLFTWFGIPLSLQAFYGADVLHAARRVRWAGLALTPLVWVADAVAIHAGAWQISGTRTVGVSFAGLPMEEAVFFFLVNLLVINSIVLVTESELADRDGRWAVPLRRKRPAHMKGSESCAQ